MAYGSVTNIRRRILRSIFIHLRNLIVQEGYLPNRDNFDKTEQGAILFESAKRQIVEARGFCIDIYGHSIPSKKEVMKVPRMVIQMKRNVPGEVGNQFGINEYIPIEGGIRRVTHQGRAENLTIDLSLISASAEQDDILHAIASAALRQVNYIPYYDAPTEYFMIDQIDDRDETNTIESLLKYVHTFQVKDIYTSGPQIHDELLQPISEISVEVNQDEEELESFTIIAN